MAGLIACKNSLRVMETVFRTKSMHLYHLTVFHKCFWNPLAKSFSFTMHTLCSILLRIEGKHIKTGMRDFSHSQQIRTSQFNSVNYNHLSASMEDWFQDPLWKSELTDIQISCTSIKWHSICIESTHILLYTLKSSLHGSEYLMNVNIM